MSCRARYWSRVPTWLRQLLPDSPTQTGKFSTRYKKAQVLHCFHYWRRPGLTVHSQQTTNRSLTCRPRPRSYRETRVGTLAAHLFSSANFSQFQSAYRKWHSTETGLLEVLLDGVFTAADDKQVTVLIVLDLSAVFDTGGPSSSRWTMHESHATEVNVGVPQGSVLGPPLFAVYCSPTSSLTTARRTLSPIRRRYAAPSRLERRQHTRRAVRSTDVRQWHTCRTVYSSTQTSQKLWSSERPISCWHQMTLSVSSVSMAEVDLPVYATSSKCWG